MRSCSPTGNLASFFLTGGRMETRHTRYPFLGSTPNSRMTSSTDCALSGSFW